MREEPRQLQVYKHFKGTYYQVLCVAKHSETEEKLVIYRPLFEGTGVYARPLEMFLSEVDHEKYPDVKQKYRFALVTGQHRSRTPDEQDDSEQEDKADDTVAEGKDDAAEADEATDDAAEAEADEETDDAVDADTDEETDDTADSEADEGTDDVKDELLDAFLDADTSEEKLDILTGSWKTITEENIDNIAVVLDMELRGETLEEKYKEILSCLKMRAKYESSRLR